MTVVHWILTAGKMSLKSYGDVHQIHELQSIRNNFLHITIISIASTDV